jgi:putative heme-binding domain-containing protein
METLKERQASRLAELEKLQSMLGHGDVGEGRKLFFGKALCSTCHAVTGSGGTFGPDLTNIGEIRSTHDILEAILYPDASLAREYETSKVVTKSTSYTGIITEQLAESLSVETGPGVIVRLSRSEITAIEPQNVSLMPPGLEKQLTTQEMSDLMAYLSTLPDGMGHLKAAGGGE